MTESSMHDETLGRLQWDKSLDRWSTDIDIGLDRSVERHIAGTDKGPSAALLRWAKRLVERLRQRERDFRLTVATQMLDCYNDAWNDGPPISLEPFAESLELDSIAVLDEHTAEAAYVPVDEDMFGGHFIVCTIRDDDAVSDTHLIG